MKRILYFSLLFLISGILNQVTAQQKNNSSFTVAFYNVENLFDTIDDPNIKDDSFTPLSEKEWNTKRYQKKINDIAKVLSSLQNNKLPEIIGLAEVENAGVLKDLTENKHLKNGDYSFIHYNSPDERGIDVALLSKKHEFNVINSHSIPIIFPLDRETKVRDILYVKGYNKTDTLHIFVNHWKSRYGGRQETEDKRIYSARVLKDKTDSILNKNPKAKIIAIGDFNDEPLNKSLHAVLGAKSPGSYSQDTKLYNLFMEEDENSKGTYNYKYEWYMLDNFIVSASLIHPEKGYGIDTDDVYIYKKDWVLFDHPKAGMKIPNRTYGGPNYYGGISDHLAIYGIFHLKGKE